MEKDDLWCRKAYMYLNIYFLAPCLLRKFSPAGFMMAIVRGQWTTKLRGPSILSVSRGFRTVERTAISKLELLLDNTS